MQYQVEDGKDIETLTSNMKKYKVDSLGSLLVKNTCYYQSFMGTLIVPELTPVIDAIPEVTEVIPKPVVKRRSRTKVPKET